jgi:hypothetical protein
LQGHIIRSIAAATQANRQRFSEQAVRHLFRIIEMRNARKPRLAFNPALYLSSSISDLNGPFEGHIEGSDVFIQFVDSQATITGTAKEKASIKFGGNANLLEN